MKTYSLAELATHLQRVVAMNFQEPIWVRAEILQSKLSRGHTYLELVQKNANDDEIAAQLSATLWSRQRSIITQKISTSLDQFLKEGTEVSLLVDVTFHTTYGLSLSILDLDPTYTLGKLQLVRQQTIERLQSEQLFARNKELALPNVLQRIAVISAVNAAGYQDFVHQIRQNEYGYDFSITLFSNAMQGQSVERDLIKNLAFINSSRGDFDCVVIIRGGGSKLDLRAFDQYEIAKAIALLKLPMLSGIGHETDHSVVDMVSHSSFKTPTAVATYLIDVNLNFETSVLTLFNDIEKSVASRLVAEREKLVRMEQHLMSLPQKRLLAEKHRLDHLARSLTAQFELYLSKEQGNLLRINDLLRTLDPRSILERGYAYIMQEGKVVKRASEIKENDMIQTTFLDGVIHSQVQKDAIDERLTK